MAELLEGRISRRDLLNYSIFLPFVFSTQSRPWSSKNWWPIFPQTAARYNLPRLHDVDGPLYVHDVEHEKVFGIKGQAREWAKHIADLIIDQNPEMRDWAGYCHAMANAAILEEEPRGSARFDRATKEGLLAAKHAGDIMIYKSPNEMVDLIRNGSWLVVDLPERPGRWFRVAYSVSGQNIRVTNFGLADKPLPISNVVGAWEVYENDSIEVPEEVKAITAGWANPHLNREIVDLIIKS